MIVGVHRLADETLRLHEYSPGFDPERFDAHERFFLADVPQWVRERFDVALPANRTAVCGVSASGELALAIGLRNPDNYAAIFCASPGGGYRPPDDMARKIPRTYLVAGTDEPFFLLGLNWGIVAIYVPALRASSLLILIQLLRRTEAGRGTWRANFSSARSVRWTDE